MWRTYKIYDIIGWIRGSHTMICQETSICPHKVPLRSRLCPHDIGRDMPWRWNLGVLSNICEHMYMWNGYSPWNCQPDFRDDFFPQRNDEKRFGWSRNVCAATWHGFGQGLYLPTVYPAPFLDIVQLLKASCRSFIFPTKSSKSRQATLDELECVQVPGEAVGSANVPWISRKQRSTRDVPWAKLTAMPSTVTSLWFPKRPKRDCHKWTWKGHPLHQPTMHGHKGNSAHLYRYCTEIEQKKKKTVIQTAQKVTGTGWQTNIIIIDQAAIKTWGQGGGTKASRAGVDWESWSGNSNSCYGREDPR